MAKLNGNNSDVNITQTFSERVRALYMLCIDTAVPHKFKEGPGPGYEVAAVLGQST